MNAAESLATGSARVAGTPARTRSALEISLLTTLRAPVAVKTAMPVMDAAIARRRREALDWLEQHGLPSIHDEAWRNSGLNELLKLVGTSPATDGQSVDLGVAEGALLIVDGRTVGKPVGHPGVTCLPLNEVMGDARVAAQLGAHIRLDDGFVAANTAGFGDGWCIFIEPGVVVDVPVQVHIVSSSTVEGDVSLPRLLVVAGAGSKVHLVERHRSSDAGQRLCNLVAEVVVDQGATVEHSRWVELGETTFSVASTGVTVAERGEYRSWSISGRGRYVRHRLDVRLAGRNATAVLDGLYYARAGQTVDQRTRVWHEQPEGSTRECYRGVIEDRGRGIFDGIIYVGHDAMKTDARQENRNLLLGPEAVAHAKPHLEIDADDVTCSHGATIGQLDESQLFYLRARGISESDAKAVLTWAFAKDIVDRGAHVGLRAEVERSLQVPGASALEGGVDLP